MSRDVGELTPIQDTLPDWLAVFIAFLTQLGDIWFLAVLLAALYWTRVDYQEEVAQIAGLLVAGIGLYRTLKFSFGLDRPHEPLLEPELVPWIIRPLYEASAFSHSYGFPSGHATIATIVYFGLAAVLPYSTARRRYALATLLVVLVSFTRLALGLHFLVDVLVGAVLGLVILYVGLQALDRISGDRTSLLLGMAILLNATYLLVSDFHVEAIIMLGAAAGFFGGWQFVILASALVEADRPADTVRPLALRGGLGILALAPLFAVLDTFAVLSGNGYPVGGLVGLATAVVVIVPIARYSFHVQQFTGSLSFWAGTLIGAILQLVRPSTWVDLWHYSKGTLEERRNQDDEDQLDQDRSR